MNIADALSGRAGLAGVQWVLLGRQAREVLLHELGALLEDANALERCDLHRAKFKPGRKLTAYYDVYLRGTPDAAQRARPIAVTWQPPGDADRSAASAEALEMQGEALHRGLIAPFRRLHADHPAWGMRIHVSPLDVRFPQLVRVSDPRYVTDLIAAAYAASERTPVPSANARYVVTPIRYRPGQRHVLRYDALDMAGRTQSGETTFAKLYVGESGARAFRVATSVAGWLAASGKGLSAVRPLAYLAADGVILYPQVAGTPLSEAFQRPNQEPGQFLETIGSALQALHRAPVELAGDLKTNDFISEITAIARASEHVHALLPAAGEQIAATLDRARALHEQMPQEPPTFAHGDLKADHVWITPAGLTLIDFDTCFMADPAIDVGKFLADLQWWYALREQPGVEHAQRQFLAGYESAAVPPARLVRARLYEALVLIKMTVRRVRLFDPDWKARTAQLVARASRLLDLGL